MPPTIQPQQIAESPQEAIAQLERELQTLKGQGWVRNYGRSTMSGEVGTVPNTEQIQNIGLACVRLSAFAVEVAAQQGAHSAQQDPQR